MREFIINYYDRMRDYLLQAKTEDIEEVLSIEIEHLEEDYYNEIGKKMASAEIDCSEHEEQDPVRGLFKKFDRLHGKTAKFVDRDNESRLAIKLDFGLGDTNPPCPYSEEDCPEIQRKIISFISKRVLSTEDVDVKPLLSGVVQTQISQEQMMYIVDNLTQISHFITDYVDCYDDGSWNWLIDSPFIFQYVFEKSAELTYLVSKGENSEGLQYDIRDAFSYFQLSVPDELQMIIDGAVETLENIVMDITSFIERGKYHLCNKETWFRPIVFNIALAGMRFTLEQEL